MKYEEITPRMKRISKTSLCPICNKPITDFQDIQIISIPYGRRMLHSFIHTECLLASLISSQLGGVKNEEKEIQTAEIN